MTETQTICRLFRLAHLASHGRRMNIQELCANLAVSPATLKRDLCRLRQIDGFKVEYDRFSNSYGLRDPVANGRIRVSNVDLSTDDVLALKITASILQSECGNTPIATRLKAIHSQLTTQAVEKR
jgi:hypothetical protein